MEDDVGRILLAMGSVIYRVIVTITARNSDISIRLCGDIDGFGSQLGSSDSDVLVRMYESLGVCGETFLVQSEGVLSRIVPKSLS